MQVLIAEGAVPDAAMFGFGSQVKFSNDYQGYWLAVGRVFWC